MQRALAAERKSGATLHARLEVEVATAALEREKTSHGAVAKGADRRRAQKTQRQLDALATTHRAALSELAEASRSEAGVAAALAEAQRREGAHAEAARALEARCEELQRTLRARRGEHAESLEERVAEAADGARRRQRRLSLSHITDLEAQQELVASVNTARVSTLRGALEASASECGEHAGRVAALEAAFRLSRRFARRA